MKANLKDVFKGKSKYILILPLIFMLLFGLVMYMDKNSPAKASDSHSSVYMEPPVEDTKAVRNKVAAYEMEDKQNRQDEETEKDSQFKESDIFFSADDKREEERQNEKRFARLKEDPYQRAVSQYNLNKELSTHAFASRMTAQLNDLEDQEASRAEKLKKESQDNYDKKMQEVQDFQKKMYDTYISKQSSQPVPAEKPQTNEPEQTEGEDYEIPSAPIYTSDGKRFRRGRLNIPEKKNLIKASVYGNQTVVNGGTVKMRLREPIFTGGIEIPANTIFFGTAELGSSRLRIKVSNIRYGSYIAPVNYIIYDSDAIEGLNLPSSLKAEATQRIKQGLVQNIQMPISSIGTMASEVTSAISATTQIAKQVIGQSLSQIKVELKANYNLFLKEETQEDMKKREAEDAELEKLYQQMLLQKNEPKKKNYLKKIFDSL
jgi:conjugative transposon TraM protein